MVHGSTAYFSKDHNVYSYTVSENKWTKLPHCRYRRFAMAVINDSMTTIGGRDRHSEVTNTLLCLCGILWVEVLPPMPTKRMFPAAANTPTHLVVAGGRKKAAGFSLVTVEVLNTDTLQWSTASSFPKIDDYHHLTKSGGRIYLTGQSNDVFSCSVEDLLKSTNSSDDGSVWTELARIPTQWESSLATLRGHVVAIGGRDGGNPTGAIHCYNVATNSWSVIGEMPTPRSLNLTAVLPSNELVVVEGGWFSRKTALCSSTDIGICSSSL